MYPYFCINFSIFLEQTEGAYFSPQSAFFSLHLKNISSSSPVGLIIQIFFQLLHIKTQQQCPSFLEPSSKQWHKQKLPYSSKVFNRGNCLNVINFISLSKSFDHLFYFHPYYFFLTASFQSINPFCTMCPCISKRNSHILGFIIKQRV